MFELGSVFGPKSGLGKSLCSSLFLLIGTTVLFLFAVAVVGQALTPSTFLTTVDRARLKAVFESAQPYTDSASAHYSILGLKLLGATIPKEQVRLRSQASR